MERQLSNGTSRVRGTALSLVWEAIGLTIIALESIRILDDSDGGVGSLAGLVGGVGIFGLAAWDHITTGGRGMARAAENRWWLAITGGVALILLGVVVVTVAAR